jgi:hypothetical protein
MKKIALVILLALTLGACEESGTTYTDYKPLALPTGDTLKFMVFYPSKGTSLWVGYNPNLNIQNLTYAQGKTNQSVVIVNGRKDADQSRVINGTIISENDSVIVVKKNK